MILIEFGGVKVSTGILKHDKRAESGNLFKLRPRLNINARNNISVSSRSVQVAA